MRQSKEKKYISAIAVSSYAREVNSADVVAAGFQKYILKSTVANELVPAIVKLTEP
ncbi:MAG TPA: hypothetical protein V6D09_17270 [Leptolyngbyaceae cyanobacterium]